MAITPKTEKQGKHACGFCMSGHHHSCNGGILNGNQTEVYLCGCTEHDLVVRCLECNNRAPGEVSRETWTCTDAEGCAMKVARRREEFNQTLAGRLTNPNRAKATEVAPKAPVKPKTGTCLCCGETTGGGLFRPGHDSKYLTSAVTLIRDGQISLDDTLTKWGREGISPALQAKLQKRVA